MAGGISYHGRHDFGEWEDFIRTVIWILRAGEFNEPGNAAGFSVYNDFSPSDVARERMHDAVRFLCERAVQQHAGSGRISGTRNSDRLLPARVSPDCF